MKKLLLGLLVATLVVSFSSVTFARMAEFTEVGGGGGGQMPVVYEMHTGIMPETKDIQPSLMMPPFSPEMEKKMENKKDFNMPEKYALLLQQLVISMELGDAREIVKEEHLEQGIEISPEYMDGAVAAHFKVPVSVVEMANDIESYDDEIPTVSLLITTVGPATQENLDALRGDGYEVQGVFGRLVQVEVPLTVLISKKTGLQTFDFVLNSTSPLGMIEN